MDSKEVFLELKKLSKEYLDGSNQKRIVLDDVDLKFFNGEIIAIVGKSGSGKSTLLNLISGIDEVSSGSLYLYGQDITQLKEKELTTLRRNHIGFVFQFFNLLPTLTVGENVSLPLELKNSRSRMNPSVVESMLSEVDMLDRKDEFPDKLSGGEQQRVAIARALVHNPGLILADEPTGNLDEKNGMQVMQLLTNLTRKNGNNMILVTHSRNAAEFADRRILISNGKLVEAV
jgi:putative ABC transport system ATP-binding protein